MQNPAGTTPLMLAAYKGREDIVKILLNERPDVDMQDGDGRTALMVAAERYDDKKPDVRYLEIVKSLLAAGANTAIKNKSGKTIYDYIYAQRKHLFNGPEKIERLALKKLLEDYDIRRAKYNKEVVAPEIMKSITSEQHFPKEIAGIVADYAAIPEPL